MKKAFYFLTGFYLLAIALQLFISLYINGFYFAYPLDDPYIHLAIAKNLSNYGVWGVSAFAFSPSSSSLLFTILIALCNSTISSSIYTPLFINIISGIFLLFVLMKISIKEQFSIKIYYLLGLLMIMFLPLIALTFVGMEHILQISFCLLLVYYVSDIFEKNKISFKTYVFIASIATIAISLRYETIFILFGIGVLLLIKKRFKDILIMTILPLAPIIVFGSISLENGAYFLPNSLMMKGISPELNLYSILNLSFLWFERVLHYPHILSSFIILAASIFLIDKNKRNLSNRKFVFNIITIIAFILHLTFARIGWFYRYESYLIALLLFSFVSVLVDVIKLHHRVVLNYKKISIIVLIIIATPFFARTVSSIYKSSLAPKNIYEQQIQMAKFVNKYYQNSTIVLNDIGAVAYFNKVKIIDVKGLASTEIARAIKQNNFTNSFLDSLSKAKKANLAILYDLVTKFKLPKDWEKVAKWKIKNNIVCWKDEVFFYAIGKNNYPILKEKLKKFENKLPKDVIIKYY